MHIAVMRLFGLEIAVAFHGIGVTADDQIQITVAGKISRCTAQTEVTIQSGGALHGVTFRPAPEDDRIIFAGQHQIQITVVVEVQLLSNHAPNQSKR